MSKPDLGRVIKLLTKNRYVLLTLCLGLVLLLLPRRSAAETSGRAAGDPMAASGIPVDTECERIALLLSDIQGVGETAVLISGSGAVIVCAGANDPAVRLNVTNAVAAYTGLGCDKITVMKMK